MIALPKEFEPILAEISHLNDLLRGNFFEVIYHDGKEWCAYFSSDTFQNGEQVIRWLYAKECFTIFDTKVKT